MGLHRFPGADTIFDPEQPLVLYNDRWNNIIEAGWPSISSFDRFGDPTGYQDGRTPPATFNYLREVRPQMTVPVLSGIAPERPEPPLLEENGTQIVVRPGSPYVGHGAAQTQMDVRYRKLAAGAPAEPWVVLSNVSLDTEGRYVISPTGTGGLDAHTDYAVAIRYHNANGPGAWSRNYTFTNPNTSPVT